MSKKKRNPRRSNPVRPAVASPEPRLLGVKTATPAQPEPLLVDIKAAASLLSSTVWAMRQLLWGKKIPYIRIGRRFLIDPADLRQFVARQKGGEQ